MIELDSENPAIVDMMIQFFYSLNYNDGASAKQKVTSQVTNSGQNNPDENGPTYSSPLLNNALVYAMADKYQVEWLKERAISKTWYRLSEAFKLKEFSDAIETVWTSTPSSDKGMRHLFLENFLTRRPEILEGSVADTSPIWANNDFLQDVIRADAEILQCSNKSALAISKRMECSGCGERELSCRICARPTGVKLKPSHKEPRTTMFSEPESKGQT